MRAEEACKVCTRKKARMYTELYQASEERKEEVLKQAERCLEEAGTSQSAPKMMAGVLDLLKRETGILDPYERIKREYNQMLLSMEEEISRCIHEAKDPFRAALQYVTVGNYIDFGALSDVSEEQLRKLLNGCGDLVLDPDEVMHFQEELGRARELLYITDNAGEIVLDKIFMNVLKELYPKLQIHVLVRGEPVLNDATLEDAKMIGLNRIARVIPNGTSIPGTEYAQISEEARECMDRADLCLAKGQGNFESLRECGKNIYYLFLCKCDLFVERFQVGRLTPAFVNELRMDHK